MGLSILKITGTGTTPRSILRSLRSYRGARMVSTVDRPNEDKAHFSSSSISPLLMLPPTFEHATKIAGWLACFNLYLQNELFLLNPLPGRHFNLPPIHNLEICRYDMRNPCSDPESFKCWAWDLGNPQPPSLVNWSDNVGQSDLAQNDVYRYVYQYMLPDRYPLKTFNYKVFKIVREGDWGKFNQVMFVGWLSYGMAIPAADGFSDDTYTYSEIARGIDNGIFDYKNKTFPRYELRISCSDSESTKCRKMDSVFEAWDLRNPRSPSLVWSCGVNKLDYCSNDSVGQSDPAQNDVSRQQYPVVSQKGELFLVYRYVYPYMLPEGSCATMDPEEDSYSESGYPPKTGNYKVFNIAREGDDGGKKVYMDGHLDDQVMFVGMLAIPAADAKGFQSPSLVCSCGVNKLHYCSDYSVRLSDPAQNGVSRYNYHLGRRRIGILGVNKDLNWHHSLPPFKITSGFGMALGIRHYVKFTAPTSFKCPLCKGYAEVGKGPGVRSMRNHYRLHHPDIYAEAEMYDYICKCGICFVDEVSYEEHKKTCEYLKWKAPPRGMLKLNVDGCCQWPLHPANASVGPEDEKKEDKTGECGAAGLMRDFTGFCSWVYRAYLGILTPKSAELTSLIIGLLTTREKGINKVMVETDCLELVRDLRELILKKEYPKDVYQVFIPKPKDTLYEYKLLIAKFILMENGFEYEVSHAFREANKPADRIAYVAYVKKEEYSLLEYRHMLGKSKGFIKDDAKQVAEKARNH